MTEQVAREADAQAPTRASRGVTMHGLRAVWRVEGVPGDPVARLLAGFPPSDANANAPAHLTIRVTAAPKGALGLDRAQTSGRFEQSFFHGKVRGLHNRDDGAFLLVAPSAEVLVAADGALIDAQVDVASYDERSFANTTLFVALSIALRHHRRFHLHAGALVRSDGRRVLIMGESGAGKSTVTLALLDAGSRHLGDDSLFLAEADGAACLLGFPRPFHLGPATMQAFPTLPAGLADASGKRDVALSAIPGATLAQMAGPDVVLFPRVTREPKTHATPIPLSDAFGASLASAALVVVDGMPHKKEQLTLLRGLLANARAYDLALGADWLVDVANAHRLVPL